MTTRLTIGHLLIAVFVILLIRMGFALPHINEDFMRGDSDDQMRLVMVRDWLGGQSWFDTHQYRLLPPEGVSMHWSRYVDAGIAAILVPLRWVFSDAQTQTLTLVIWPSLLLMLLVTVFGLGMNRLGGLTAAAGAIVAAFVWERLGGGEFKPGRIDHHNLQLLFSSVVAVAAILQVRRMGLLGACAGIAAALALAIGLEMLPFLLLIWGLAALRMVFDIEGAARWLAGFAGAIGVSAPALMAGQTPISEWGVFYCDELAPPVLILIGIGVAASLIALGVRQRTPQPVIQILVLAVLAGFGLWLAAPVLGPCLTGPYGAMTAEARSIILDRVVEAQPAFVLARTDPDVVSLIMVPFGVTVLAAGLLGWFGRADLTWVQRLALVQTLIIAGIGLVFSMVQIRALNIGVPAVPILAGFVTLQLSRLMAAGRQRLGALLMLAITAAFVMPNLPLEIVRSAQRSATGTARNAAATAPDLEVCQSPAAVDQLNALSPAVIMSSLNFGTFILAFSAHATTSAPYHRSPDAFWNGVGTFADEDAMKAAVSKSHADYVVICRGDATVNTSEFAQRLLGSDLPLWLSDSKFEGPLTILSVNSAALSRD